MLYGELVLISLFSHSLFDCQLLVSATTFDQPSKTNVSVGCEHREWVSARHKTKVAVYAWIHYMRLFWYFISQYTKNTHWLLSLQCHKCLYCTCRTTVMNHNKQVMQLNEEALIPRPLVHWQIMDRNIGYVWLIAYQSWVWAAPSHLCFRTLVMV